MAAKYGWIIDWENPENTEGLDDMPSRVGWLGPRDISPEVTARLWQGEGTPFRLLSDDQAEADHLDFTGRIIMLAGTDGYAEFAPLDDIGRPDVGSTTIQYQEQGSWVAL